MQLIAARAVDAFENCATATALTKLATFETFVAEVGFEPDQHWRLSPCQTQDCPAAGDVEEHPTTPTGGHYTNNATCVFGTPTKRRLLFGPMPVTPKAGVCVP